MKILAVIRVTMQTTREQVGSAFLKSKALAKKLGGTIEYCVYGSPKALQRVDSQCMQGTVYQLEIEVVDPCAIAESLLAVIQKQQHNSVVFTKGDWANSVAALLAEKSNRAYAGNVEAVQVKEGEILASRLVYSNTLHAEYELPFSFVITERMPEIPFVQSETEAINLIHLPSCTVPSYILNHRLLCASKAKRYSPILLVAGMGVSQKEELGRIRAFAHKNGFDFYVSRPVAMRGWADIDEIIGVSGTILSPKITIAIGVSGAAALFVGIEKSQYILSVNTNPNAMIIEQSDAIILDDYQNVLGGLFTMLEPYRIE